MKGLIALTLALGIGAAAADNEVIGTIETTIDGEPQTWYLLQPPGDVPPTALWVAFGPDRGAASLSAYASPDIELVQEPTTGATIPKDDAAVLLVSFAFPVDAESGHYTLPTDTATDLATVVLMDNWRDMLDQWNLNQGPGEIAAEVIDARQDGPSRFEGTFHGTLRGGSDEARRLTDGRFSTDSARFHQAQ